jgi:hypothetical protein
LNGKTFRTQRDPWRGISRAAFGLDYLKQFDCIKAEDKMVQSFEPNANSREGRFGFRPQTEQATVPKKLDDDVKMMELNDYDYDENPTYKYDVFVQRLSVYLQLSEGEVDAPPDLDDIRNPYNEDEYRDYQMWRKQYRKESIDVGKGEMYVPKLKSLDNGRFSVRSM